MADCPDRTLYERLTSRQERRLRDLKRWHLDALVSELKVQNTGFIDGEHITEVKRSYVVTAAHH